MDIDIARLLALPVDERIRLAELLWGSIGSNPGLDTLPLPPGQRAELDRRLAEYPDDGDPGLTVDEGLADLRRRVWPAK